MIFKVYYQESELRFLFEKIQKRLYIEGESVAGHSQKISRTRI